MAISGSSVSNTRSARCISTFKRIALVSVLGLVLANCTTSTKALLSEARTPSTNGAARVVLMAPDIELSELSAGGVTEPNAAWTLKANSHVRSALTRVLREKNASLIPAGRNGPVATDLTKLHSAVGNTILLHKYLPQLALPTKKDRFDWTLGPDAKALRRKYKADYALFVFMRDSYSSDGRKALMVVGALLGANVSGGRQVGFASLVDLRNGDIVWFNRLFSTTGDLREADPALVAVRSLLDKVPL